MTRHQRAALAGAVLIALVSSCTVDESTPVEVPVLSYSDSSIVIKMPDCEGQLSECGGVDIRFPVLVGGGPGVADRINRRVYAFFAEQLGSGETDPAAVPDIRAAAQLVVSDFVSFRQDFPLSEQIWVVEGTGTIETIDSLVCIYLSTYSYLGGAHPNLQASYVVAHAATGEPIPPGKLAQDSVRFHRAAEAAFKSEVGMDADDSDYSAKGFWFNDNQFVLPENIGVTPDSVILHYNAYEIAPYSMGPTVIMLPRTILGR